jgi:hypothetical protein
LVLPSGHLRGPAAPQVREAEPTEDLARGGERGGLALSGQAKRQGCIFLDGQLGEQFAVLEDEPEPLAAERAEFLVGQLSEDAPLESDLAARDGQHSGQAVKQRRLARAALPADRRDLTTTEGDLRVPDRGGVTVEEVDVRGGQDF